MADASIEPLPTAPAKHFYVHGTLPFVKPTTFLPTLTHTCACLGAIMPAPPPHPLAMVTTMSTIYNNDNDHNKLRGGYYPRIFPRPVQRQGEVPQEVRDGLLPQGSPGGLDFPASAGGLAGESH